MKQQDPIANLGALSPEDRAWIIEGLSPRARDELLHLTRGELGDAGFGSDASAADDDNSTPMAVLTERLAKMPVSALADVLGGEPVWFTAALLRAAHWPWRTQLLQRLPHVAVCLCPTLEPTGAVLTQRFTRALLQRIADQTGSVPVAVVTKFERLVQQVAARRIAAWRSI